MFEYTSLKEALCSILAFKMVGSVYTVIGNSLGEAYS